MKSLFTRFIFAFIFHFIATASVVSTDNIRLKAGIVILQFIFLLYQIFAITRKDKIE